MTNLVASMLVHSLHSTLIAFPVLLSEATLISGRLSCPGAVPRPSVFALTYRCNKCIVTRSDTGSHTAGANAAKQHVCFLRFHTAPAPGMQIESAPLITMHVNSKAHQWQQGCFLAGDEVPSGCTLDTACILLTRRSITSGLFVMLPCLLEQMAISFAALVWNKLQAACSAQLLPRVQTSIGTHSTLKR